MILPTIAPIAVPPSLDEPGGGVGPAEVELDWVDPVKEVTVSDGTSDVIVDDVGGKVEEGSVVAVEEGVGVAFVELGGVADTDDISVVLGGVGPP